MLAIAALAVGAALIAFGCLASPWSALEYGGRIRYFIVFIAALLAWSLATLGYNYYYDQGYVLERMLLVLLLPLIWYRPLFVFPFLIVAYAMLWQTHEPPLGAGAMLPHKTHLMRVLVLFAAALIAHAITGSRSMRGFIFLTCCLIGAVYWLPVLTKWQLDWLSHGHLYRMILSAHAHGWLAWLQPVAAVDYARRVASFDLTMQVYVLVIETGCLLILWRRWLTVTLLVGVSVFHVGVFVLYGYLFWTWISLNLAMVVLLLSDRSGKSWQLYGGNRAILAALLVFSGSIWASPSSLGWYDTRLTYTYRYEVTGESGTRYTLPVRFFEPYGDVFTMANFGYLPDTHKMLVFPYGITHDPGIAAGLNTASTPEDIFALEEQLGNVRHQPDRALRFYEFIRRYVVNYNATGVQLRMIAALGPPPQFWSDSRGRIYTGQEPVREVAVFEVTTLFDESHLKEIRVIELARIPVPDE